MTSGESRFSFDFNLKPHGSCIQKKDKKNNKKTTKCLISQRFTENTYTWTSIVLSPIYLPPLTHSTVHGLMHFFFNLRALGYKGVLDFSWYCDAYTWIYIEYKCGSLAVMHFSLCSMKHHANHANWDLCSQMSQVWKMLKKILWTSEDLLQGNGL